MAERKKAEELKRKQELLQAQVKIIFIVIKALFFMHVHDLQASNMREKII